MYVKLFVRMYHYLVGVRAWYLDENVVVVVINRAFNCFKGEMK